MGGGTLAPAIAFVDRPLRARGALTLPASKPLRVERQLERAPQSLLNRGRRWGRSRDLLGRPRRPHVLRRRRLRLTPGGLGWRDPPPPVQEGRLVPVDRHAAIHQVVLGVRAPVDGPVEQPPVLAVIVPACVPIHALLAQPVGAHEGLGHRPLAARAPDMMRRARHLAALLHD